MSVWMDWFKGKFTGKPHDLHGKIYGFRLRFSLKPIHWLLQQTTSIGGFKNRGHEPGAGCTWLGLSQQHPSSTGGLRERLAEFPSRDDGELQGRRLNQLACWFISLLILNKWYIYIYTCIYICLYKRFSSVVYINASWVVYDGLCNIYVYNHTYSIDYILLLFHTFQAPVGLLEDFCQGFAIHWKLGKFSWIIIHWEPTGSSWTIYWKVPHFRWQRTTAS